MNTNNTTETFDDEHDDTETPESIGCADRLDTEEEFEEEFEADVAEDFEYDFENDDVNAPF